MKSTKESYGTKPSAPSDVGLLVGHAASDAAAVPAYCAVCRERPNVSLDLCGSTLWRGLLEQMVALAGAYGFSA